MAGLGPFVLERVPRRPAHDVHAQPALLAEGRRRHRSCRTSTRIVMEFVASQDAEILRLQAGSVDLMTQADVRPKTSRRCGGCATRARCSSRTSASASIRTCSGSTSRRAPAAQKAKPYLQRTEFRQAIAYAVDRDAIVNTVYLGAAVPIYGPVTPGNRTWYSDERAEVSARSGAREGAARGHRPHRSQRRRHARRRRGPAGAVFDPHAGRQHPRAGRDDDPGAAAAGRHHGRRRRRSIRRRCSRASARATTRASTTASRRARSIRR